MGTRKKALLALLAVVCLAVLSTVLYLLTLPGDKDRAVLETVGVVEAAEVELSAKTSGRIEWLCCAEGDAIKAGMVAARLERVEPGARLDEARAALDVVRASLDEARVGVENAAAQREAASFELEASEAEARRLAAVESESSQNLARARALFKDGYIPKRDMDSAEADYAAKGAALSSGAARVRAAEAALRATESAIKAARARVSAIEARIAQAEAGARIEASRLDDTEITAPVDGVVAYRAFEPGEVVGPGASIYTLHGLGDIWARIDVEETELARVRLGSPAEVRAVGDPLVVFEGAVSEVGQVASFATQRDVTRGRADIKTFRVRVRIINNPEGNFEVSQGRDARLPSERASSNQTRDAGIKPDGSLKPGMTVIVRILP